MNISSADDQHNIMGTKPVFPLLLSMSLPVMLSMLIQSVYNIIDSFWVAKLGTDALTAVSLAYPLQNILLAAGVGMGIGISARISICLGRKDRYGAGRAASMGLMLVLVHCIFFIAADRLLTVPFLSMFTDDESILSQACNYAHIVVSLSFGLLIQICIEKIFQGAGKMLITMFLMASGCIINIILDPVMIFGLFGFPALGVKGAAFATVIGQISAMLLYILVYRLTDIGLDIRIGYARFDAKLAALIYKVSIPSALMLALPSVLTGILNGILSCIGTVYVAVLGLFFKLQTFVNMPANGIIQGMRPVIGYNYGAHCGKRARQAIRYSMILVAVISLAGTILSVFFPAGIMQMFDAGPEMLREGVTALRIIGPSFLLSTVSVVVCGVLEALGEGPASLRISLLRQLVITVPAAWLLSRYLGPAGVWIAFPAAELAALFPASAALAKIIRVYLKD